jgi:4-diphosphocytidyl-2-C-methyl-D-erythritol kinase
LGLFFWSSFLLLHPANNKLSIEVMICFPNAKVNIGLDVLRKRTDGYHDINTLFYPLRFSDVLEVVPDSAFSYTQTGILIDGYPEDNLVVKAYRLMQQHFKLPPVKIHLHKLIPIGAGLGGGSSDAAFMLTLLNKLFKLNLISSALQEMAIKLGSDCPFFLYNQAVMASKRGEEFTEINDFSLKGYTLLLITPPINVSTATAYAGIKPEQSTIELRDRLSKPVDSWKNNVINQFEPSVFTLFPELARLKQELYNSGAVYASMSGSGAALYGLYKTQPEAPGRIFEGCGIWMETCN